MNIKEMHLTSNNDGTYKLYYELMGVDGSKIKVTIPKIINLEYDETYTTMKYNNMSIDMPPLLRNYDVIIESNKDNIRVDVEKCEGVN